MNWRFWEPKQIPQEVIDRVLPLLPPDTARHTSPQEAANAFQEEKDSRYYRGRVEEQEAELESLRRRIKLSAVKGPSWVGKIDPLTAAELLIDQLKGRIEAIERAKDDTIEEAYQAGFHAKETLSRLDTGEPIPERVYPLTNAALEEIRAAVSEDPTLDDCKNEYIPVLIKEIIRHRSEERSAAYYGTALRLAEAKLTLPASKQPEEERTPDNDPQYYTKALRASEEKRVQLEKLLLHSRTRCDRLNRELEAQIRAAQ